MTHRAPCLLLDQNLAPSLVPRLADLFPGSLHVRDLGLAKASDLEVWARAAQLGLVIVTKDDDFRQRSFLLGGPPRVIWLRLGNCLTDEVELVLRARYSEVRAFAADPDAALLILAKRT